MSAAQSDYYEIMGLSSTATPTEIKKRYRELARRYHPDVNPSPDASQKIKIINEAYHVLGDADRRVVYDAERMLRQSAAAPKKPHSTPQPAAPPRPAQASQTPHRGGAPRTAGPARPYAAGSRAAYNGFGRTSPESATPPRGSGPRPAAAGSAARGSAETASAAENLVAEARLAFINHKPREAEILCRQALALDRRNAVAHEILGDIYMKRGSHDLAVAHYSYSIQFNSRNLSVQAKLDRLLNVPPASSPTRPIPTRGASLWQQFLRNARPETTMAGLTILLSLAFSGVLWFFADHAVPVRGAVFLWLPFLSEIPPSLFVALLVNGTIAGVLLAFYGRMRPISGELLTRQLTPNSNRMPVSLGVLLAMFSLGWFYLSLVVYIVIGIRQDRISPSVVRAYGTCVLLVMLFACLYQGKGDSSGVLQLLAFGGNFLFPGMLVGWAIGDAVRFRGR